jgi:hypothetical protein
VTITLPFTKRHLPITLVVLAVGLAACGGPATTQTAAQPSTATSSPSVGGRLTEFGALVADWDAAHRQDPRDSGTAYNPGVVDYHNGNGPEDQFVYVLTMDSGRILHIEEQFPRRTNLTEAHAAVLAELAPDAKTVWQRKPEAGLDGGCMQELYSSKSIGAALATYGDPKGLVLVEYLAGDPAANSPPWDASDITSATFSAATADWQNPADAPPC